MELTRRDAIAALGAAGVAVGGGAVALDALENRGRDSADAPIAESERATLVAAAEVLYPGEVEEIEAFVERYVAGVSGERPEHARGIADAANYLDDYAEAWHDEGFAALDPATREAVLRDVGADTADPDPGGTDEERVRYYVVNELLFALYATPTGGKLVGLENPQGYPGGTSSYQRGPNA